MRRILLILLKSLEFIILLILIYFFFLIGNFEGIYKNKLSLFLHKGTFFLLLWLFEIRVLWALVFGGFWIWQYICRCIVYVSLFRFFSIFVGWCIYIYLIFWCIIYISYLLRRKFLWLNRRRIRFRKLNIMNLLLIMMYGDSTPIVRTT